ncbi:MAG TPA: hypothetical protein PK705_06605, partial [Clostridia bacterium]|nr:hypothetical protein [Clostridia bacterium]
MEKNNTLSNIAQDIRSMERDLLNIDFWKNPSEIAGYAENIIRYAKPNETIEVNVSFRANAYCARNGSRWNVVLPQMPANINIDNNKITKLIYARTMFLKHEISHAIFSNYAAESRYHRFMNAVDDTRVEELFGRIFKGARRGFYDLRKVFFERNKGLVEGFSICRENFYTYARYTLAGFQFAKTPQTEAYAQLFAMTEIKNFFIEDPIAYTNFIADYYDSVVNPYFSALEVKNERPDTSQEQDQKQTEIVPDESKESD